MSRTLIIGSCEAFSGKSALVLGIARFAKSLGKEVRFGKPLATSFELHSRMENSSGPLIDDDVRFIGNTLGLEEESLIPSIDMYAADRASYRLANSDINPGEEFVLMKKKLEGDVDCLNILEGSGSLNEGSLYGLNLAKLANDLEAKVLLVHLWHDPRSIDALLSAKQELGKKFLGVVLNAVTPEDVGIIQENVVPSLEKFGIQVFGVMPRSPLLRSVTVSELVRRLKAKIICCSDRLELMVETLSIGAMNVNSAMEFFRKRRNMAVVTGADRTDIQLAALEASTQCLILTGAGEPLPQFISRAEELEVPLLKVNTDTLSTVEVIEHAFGHVRLHEAVKASYAFRLVEDHCNLSFLFNILECTSN